MSDAVLQLIVIMSCIISTRVLPAPTDSNYDCLEPHRASAYSLPLSPDMHSSVLTELIEPIITPIVVLYTDLPIAESAASLRT